MISKALPLMVIICQSMAFSMPAVDRRDVVLLAPSLFFNRFGLPFSGNSRSSSVLKGCNDDNPCTEGFVTVDRGDQQFKLYYRLYNSDSPLDPMVLLHGGPSLPSQYLYPIIPLLQSKRPLLFFDQLGCGKSDQPRNTKFYSIDQSVEDIKTVLSSVFLNYSSIHVLGHSFGGVLAYEFQQGSSQTDEPSRIRSLILSNAPTSMKVANDAYEDLERKNPMTFVQKYVCQVDAPPELQSAFQSAGKVWSGMDVVLQYVPQPPKDENFPPTLVVGGAHDFALPSTEGWKEVLPFATYEVLEDTSHYPFYERKDAYGDLIESFLQKVEGNG